MLTQMCSNRAIVDSLECCVDDLVEYFEDFVKKSLILIFLGIGVIVGLLCYLLKVVSERPLNNAVVVPENISHKQNEANAVIEKNTVVEQEVLANKLKENDNKKIDKINTGLFELNTHTDKDKITTVVNSSNLPIAPSFDENLLREVGLTSCSKYGCGCGSNSHIPSRVPVPSIPTSSSKYKLIPCVRKRSLNKSNLESLQICPKVTKPGSCCSMCCYDGQKKKEDLGIQIYRNHQ